MQRITEIISSVFLFFIRFFVSFAIDLYHALYFKALEYDNELQQTKTFGQRLTIWAAIITAATIIILLLLNLLYRLISNIEVVKGL